jgi:hypothetical protein
VNNVAKRLQDRFCMVLQQLREFLQIVIPGIFNFDEAQPRS